MRTPINDGILQSDLDANGFDIIGLDSVGGSLPDGGTVGQLLQKQSSADGDADWATVSGSSGGGIPLTFVNVKDAPYNATGDGVTDDTVAIQAAIDDVTTSGGGTVFFPRGIYLCNGPFHIYWKSILTIPPVDQDIQSSVSLTLLGEDMPAWSVLGTFAFDYQNASTIKTTRTDGMTADASGYAAIIAGNQPKGDAVVTDFGSMSGVMVRVKNMAFLCPDNPTMGGIRFDGMGWAFVENVTVFTQGASEPTHGTTGIWLPNAINWSISWANHAYVFGFDTGFKVGEHLRAPMIQVYACKRGVVFLAGVYPSWAQIQLGTCVRGVVFLGQHPVDLLLETEHSVGGWTTLVSDISDPSNYGTGIIKYFVGQGGGGAASIAATVEGGTGLTLMDLNSGNVRMNTTYGAAGGASTFTAANVTATTATATSTVYIGTDARLVTITGGAKLQVRNPGTGLWADADQWTNP